MLTKRQNLLECIHGGNPDRYVNQYEAFAMVMASPLSDRSHLSTDGYLIDAWGCYQQRIEGQPGFFPCTTCNTASSPTCAHGGTR